jgi:hypothetical protein
MHGSRTVTANNPAIKALGHRQCGGEDARGRGTTMKSKKKKAPGDCRTEALSQIKGGREKAKGSPLGSKSSKARICAFIKGIAPALSGSRQETASPGDAGQGLPAMPRLIPGSAELYSPAMSRRRPGYATLTPPALNPSPLSALAGFVALLCPRKAFPDAQSDEAHCRNPDHCRWRKQSCRGRWRILGLGAYIRAATCPRVRLHPRADVDLQWMELSGGAGLLSYSPPAAGLRSARLWH